MITTTSPTSLKRKETALSLVLLILCAAPLAGCGSGNNTKAENPTAAVRVAAVKVARHDISNELEIASEFLPFQEVDVYAKVSGYIQKLNVDWGTHVKQGQVLAVLEIPELQQQIQQDEAAAQRADEELSRAKSVYSVAHVTYTRLLDVQKTRPELIAQQDMDVAQGKDLEAGAGVSAAQQALLAAKAALEKDKTLFAYARMTAPFDGVVTQIYAYTGALLPAGTSSAASSSALCHLSQNNLLRLVIPVPERAVPDVHAGQTVSVHVTTNGRTFSGKIVRFSDQIDLQTRTMHTEVDVPNPRYELVPGMYASIEIPLHAVQNVLTVPVQAVQLSGDNQGAVLIVDDSNRIQRRSVTLGLQTASQVEIVSGLREGDLVLFGEQSQYKMGELVSPKIVSPSEME